MTKEREAEIRTRASEANYIVKESASMIDDLLAEVDRLRWTLVQVESHLAAIAESPCAMGGPDIEQLGMARDVIDEALEQK